MSVDSFVGEAGGNIHPSRFVALDTADNVIVQAGANVPTFGVSREGRKDSSGGEPSPYAARAGETCDIYQHGERCRVTAAESLTAGQFVKPDADGKAVAIATTGTTVQWIAGQVLEAAGADEQVKILLMLFPYRPALS